MHYAEAVAYIESLAPSILNPSLDRFAEFMRERQNLQDSIPALHIAGTNGKGSTVAILDSVLRAAGLRVGRFTGPHLLRWNERFHFGGEPIDDETFARLATKLRALSEDFGARHCDLGSLTWFEFLTALAFEFFAENRVEVAVFEVGLGGRWDATNVLQAPMVTAITTIDYDHMHILGKTLTEIAREKAGIIKDSIPVVTGAGGEALTEITKRATDKNAPLYICKAPNTVIGPTEIDTKYFYEAKRNLALGGSYQSLNGLLASVVLSVAGNKLARNFDHFLAPGFEQVFWPGRFQYIPSQNLLLDGAHNPGGAHALRDSLDLVFPERGRLFVLSYFENKDVSGALKNLVQPGDKVFVSQAKTTRPVATTEYVCELAKELGVMAEGYRSIGEALNAALASRKNNELVIASGSFATIKESMLALGWTSVEDSRPFTERA